jgi:heat shock protein HslJ
MNSLDWDGVYRGLLPCADCEGMETTIYLNKDLTYRAKVKYLGKSDELVEYNGTFKWNRPANSITFEDPGYNGFNTSYLVEENGLTQLDRNGKKVTGNLASMYILAKGIYTVVEKYWKLTELNGQPVRFDSTFNQEPHIILKDDGNKFVGNGGCNNISGSYKLEGVNRISISSVATTRMACPKMEIESQLLKALQEADSFTILEDQLILKKENMPPLAKFRTVYTK